MRIMLARQLEIFIFGETAEKVFDKIVNAKKQEKLTRDLSGGF